MSQLVTQDKPMTTPATLLQMAVQQNADLDKLEKLMDLQERWQAEQAKRAYSEALAGFQSKLDPIIKTRQGHNCKYADMDDIAQAIRPILENYGLSYTFKQEQENNVITVTCTVRHKDGHSESTKLSAPSDTSGGKNAIQAIASTVTYLRRYTLTGTLGISTGNEDTDGGKPDIVVDELLNYMAVVREWLPSIHAVKEAIALADYSTAKEAWNEIDEATMRILWRAPSKGGIFTTEERTIMKSDEWSKA